MGADVNEWHHRFYAWLLQRVKDGQTVVGPDQWSLANIAYHGLLKTVSGDTVATTVYEITDKGHQYIARIDPQGLIDPHSPRPEPYPAVSEGPMAL